MKTPETLQENKQGLPFEDKTGKVRDLRPSVNASPPVQINRKQLVNRLNFSNFLDYSLLVYFKHITFNRSFFLRAKPSPCLGRRLDCTWEERPQPYEKFQSYGLQHFLLVDNQQTLLVEPELISIDENGICFNLPKYCQEVRSREVERHPCQHIEAQLIQNSAVFSGTLLDFSAVSFRVNLTTTPPQRFQWIDPDFPVNVIFMKNGYTLFVGECDIIQKSYDPAMGAFVMKPIPQKIHRFKPKMYRSQRLQMTPLPKMLFTHPFIEKITRLDIMDISGSGFSVSESKSQSILFPGLIIPELELCFANGFKVKLKAQVIYRRNIVNDDPTLEAKVKCGLAFLDMDISDHVHLVGLLHQVKDKRSYIDCTLDLNDLWRFFFNAGFIYPEKYVFIEKKKEEIKETYRKLYTENPSIARHFIFQDNNRILGHMAMVRFYDNTWLIHHHAADKKSFNRAGLTVLEQIGQFSNDAHNLYSMHMDYLMCYFRPDNKFPNQVFGGAAGQINNPKMCSIDPFAYFHYPLDHPKKKITGTQWKLTVTHNDDLLELESFYEGESGGLTIQGLDLTPQTLKNHTLDKEYEKLGFKREKHLFSLKNNGMLKAIFLVNISDIGLNLSDLTNSITVIVLNQKNFPLEMLYSALDKILNYCGQERMPVLLFPPSYAESHFLPFEKIYHLWILGTQYGDHYFNYVNRLLRFIR